MTEDCGVTYWKTMAAEYKAASQKWEARSKANNARAEILLRELGKAIDRMKHLESALDVAADRAQLLEERLAASYGVDAPIAARGAQRGVDASTRPTGSARNGTAPG